MTQEYFSVLMHSMWFCDIFLVVYDIDRSTTHPKFDPTRVRTHDLQIVNITFHIPECEQNAIVLTTTVLVTAIDALEHL